MHKVEMAFRRGYRVDRNGVVRGILVDILSAPPNNQGYRCFTLHTDGRVTPIKVHQLQAYQKFGQEMFQEGIVVRHLNGDKLDNSWNNIAIGTRSDNAMDIPAETRHAMGVCAGRGNSRLSVEEVQEIRRLYEKEGWKNKELVVKFNIAHSTVSRIINRKRWRDI